MSKEEPHRYEFTAAEGPPTTDIVLLSLGRKKAAWMLCRIADDLAAGDEAVSVVLAGWLEDKGPRRRKQP